MQQENHRFCSRRHSNAGFTLIELMVALVVLGVLATVGIPSLASFIRDVQVSNATNEFVSAVNLARSEAIKRGKLVTICRSVNAEGGATGCHTAASGNRVAGDWGVGWLVYVESSSTASVGTYEDGEEVLLRHGALASRTFASGSSANRITFNGIGEPTGVFSINFNYDIDQNARQFCMARTGRIRILRDATDCSSS